MQTAEKKHPQPARVVGSINTRELDSRRLSQNTAKSHTPLKFNNGTNVASKLRPELSKKARLCSCNQICYEQKFSLFWWKPKEP